MSHAGSVRTTLAGRYELIEAIGRGGMGTVYRGIDRLLSRTVAVKVLADALATDDNHIARFEREARAAAAVSHPSLVAIYDTGVDGQTRFIVMEYVKGRSLDELLREQAPLQPLRAVQIAEQVAAALAAAHAVGIIHRDIKPANVMVAEGDSVKVLDFGIARPLDGATLTQGTAILGSASYMAPERLRGQRAGERSDIYSLGCLLYAMCSGRPPFTGEAAAAILHQHVNRDPPPLRKVNRAVPAALDTLTLQMLAKTPKDRPASARLVQQRLRATFPLPAGKPAQDSEATRLLQRSLHRHRGSLSSAIALAAVTLAALLAAGSGSHSPSGLLRRDQASAAGGVSAAAAGPRRRDGGSTASLPLAADELIALVARDLQAGRLDAAAATQIGGGLTAILDRHAAADGAGVRRLLAALARRIVTLQKQGRLSPLSALALQAAIGHLASSLIVSASSSPPAQAVQRPSAQAQLAPAPVDLAPARHEAHGERALTARPRDAPRGHAKKHGKGKDDNEGD